MAITTEKNLIRNLRIKFIAIIMAMVTVVLVIAFSAICYVNYSQSVAEVYGELESSISDIRTFPSLFSAQNAPDDEEDSGIFAPLIGSPDHGQRQASIPIAVYVVYSDGTTASVSDKSTAWVDTSVLSEALELVENQNDSHGFLNDYSLFYYTSDLGNDTYAIAFADESNAASWTSLAKTLALVGLVVLLVMFLLAWAFSRWASKPVAQAWDQQQQFIADASHEMKTPLTVILANTDIALRRPEATIAEQSQWLEGIQDEAKNMQELVLDMLTLAQPDTARENKDATDPEPVDLSEIVERAALQFEAVAFERGVIVDSNVDEHVSIPGDALSLQRMVTTLIDNACKYSKKDCSVDVALVSKKEGPSSAAHCLLTVHNWGDPIAPEDQEHLFDRFYRADKSRDRSSEGGSHSFGLGLAIARKIAEEHGGIISVESSEAKGTTFSVAF